MDAHEDTPRIQVLSVSDTGRRRRWTDDEKVRIVEESHCDGVTLAEVARRHDISRSQLYDWRYRHKNGLLGGNGAAAIGPFIRLLDKGFTLEDLGSLRVGLDITGNDGFELSDYSDMIHISRKPADLAGQMLNSSHQYPDGAMLYLGTMFAPTKDRGGKGLGFTHHAGDRVTVSSPLLGRLVNEVQPCDKIAPWSFGTGALMRNLAARGLLS